jgi:GHH signature containing HNH/Endo VII superfamily nuclease toxin  2
MATTPNTPATYYLDTADAKKHCATDKAEMEKKCAPDDKNKSRGKGRPKARQSHKDAGKDASWVLDHCGPLMVQPGLGNFKEWQSEFGDIQKSIGQIADVLKNNVIAKLEQEALQYAGKQIAKLAVRRGLTGWIPIVGWVMTAVDVAVTAYDAVGRVNAIRETVADLESTVNRLKDAANKISGTLDKYKADLKNFGNLSEAKQKEVASNVMADIQSAYAAADPCLRARKCMLVPFNKDTAAKWAGQGCCPGQTGHHLLPDAMFRDEAATKKAKEAYKARNGTMKGWKRGMAPTRPCWDGYTEGGSPTICVEGNNQHMGSHGVMHKLTKTKLSLGGHTGKADMSYTDARDLITTEVSQAYGCKKECLREQLDAYYCGKAASKKPGCPDCKNAKVRPHDGTGEQPEANDDGTED